MSESASAMEDNAAILAIGALAILGWLILFVVPENAKKDRIMDCIGRGDITQESWAACKATVEEEDRALRSK